MIEFHSFSTMDNHLCSEDDTIVSNIRFLWKICEYYEQYRQLGIYRLRCVLQLPTLGFYAMLDYSMNVVDHNLPCDTGLF